MVDSSDVNVMVCWQDAGHSTVTTFQWQDFVSDMKVPTADQHQVHGSVVYGSVTPNSHPDQRKMVLATMHDDQYHVELPVHMASAAPEAPEDHADHDQDNGQGYWFAECWSLVNFVAGTPQLPGSPQAASAAAVTSMERRILEGLMAPVHPNRFTGKPSQVPRLVMPSEPQDHSPHDADDSGDGRNPWKHWQGLRPQAATGSNMCQGQACNWKPPATFWNTPQGPQLAVFHGLANVHGSCGFGGSQGSGSQQPLNSDQQPCAIPQLRMNQNGAMPMSAVPQPAQGHNNAPSSARAVVGTRGDLIHHAQMPPTGHPQQPSHHTPQAPGHGPPGPSSNIGETPPAGLVGIQAATSN
jgi:hypothetical protein